MCHFLLRVYVWDEHKHMFTLLNACRKERLDDRHSSGQSTRDFDIMQKKRSSYMTLQVFWFSFARFFSSSSKQWPLLFVSVFVWVDLLTKRTRLIPSNKVVFCFFWQLDKYWIRENWGYEGGKKKDDDRNYHWILCILLSKKETDECARARAPDYSPLCIIIIRRECSAKRW